MRFFGILISSLLLSGCAFYTSSMYVLENFKESELRDILNKKIGFPITDLPEHGFYPAQQMKVDNDKGYYSFVYTVVPLIVSKHRARIMPYCRINWVTDVNNQRVSYTLEGNFCKALPKDFIQKNPKYAPYMPRIIGYDVIYH